VLSALGEAAALPLFLLLAVHSPVLGPAITVALALGQPPHLALAPLVRQVGTEVVKNPLALGVCLGIEWNLGDWPLPPRLDQFTQPLSAAAIPCGLFVTGAALSQYRLVGQWHAPVMLATLKRGLQPLLIWGLASFVLQSSPLWNQVAIVRAALPTAANAYRFAQRSQVGIGTAASVAVLSTAASCVTLTLGLLLVQ